MLRFIGETDPCNGHPSSLVYFKALPLEKILGYERLYFQEKRIGLKLIPHCKPVF